MSREVDERVVSMRFDNKEFESKCATTMSTLDKLKQKLNFKGAVTGMDEISRVASRTDMSALEKSADKVGDSFKNMSIVAISAINRVVNDTITAGKRLMNDLIFEQPKAGWSKYEQEVQATQTIMVATGQTIDQVTSKLDKLTWFTDETSYSYGDMVNNIGKFTSAGVKMDDAVSAMQGIALAAAGAGANVEAANRAMYNFSQAIGTGAVKLMDWRSIENANMATTQFKELLAETAVEQGILTKSADGFYQTMKGNTFTLNSFNTQLQDAWLNNDVLIGSLKKAGAYADKVYETQMTMGLETAAEAMEYVSDEGMELAAAWFKAGQEAKTFSDALNATKDAVSSKWKTTFSLIIGNYEEAKQLWTNVTEELYEIFAASGDRRNEVLAEWSKLGGRIELLSGIRNLFDSAKDVVNAFSDALANVFPPMTAERLYELTVRFRQFTEKLRTNEAFLNKLRTAFELLLIPLRVVYNMIKLGFTIIKTGFNILSAFIQYLRQLPPPLELIKSGLEKLFGTDRYNRLAEAFKTIVEKLGISFSNVKENVSGFFNSLRNGFKINPDGRLSKILDFLKQIGGHILDGIVSGVEHIASIDWPGIIQKAKEKVEAFGTSVTNIIESIKSAFKSSSDNFDNGIFAKFGDVIRNLADGTSTLKNNLDISKVFDSAKGNFFGLATAAENLGDKIGEAFGKLDPAKTLAFAFGTALTIVLLSVTKAVKASTGVFTGLTSIFSAIKANIAAVKPREYEKVTKCLVGLAAAIFLLSQAKPENVKNATTCLLELVAALMVFQAAMSILEIVSAKNDKIQNTIGKFSTSVLMIAASLTALSVAVKIMETVNPEGLFKKLLIFAAAMTLMVGVVWALNKVDPKSEKGFLSILAIAGSMVLVALSLQKLGDMDLEGIKSNLLTFVTVMGVFIAFTRLSGKSTFKQSLGILTGIVAMFAIVKALKKLSSVNFSEIEKGILPMLGLIVLMNLISLSIRPLANTTSKLAMTFVGIAVAIIACVEAMKLLQNIDTSSVGKGIGVLATIIGLLALLTVSMRGGEDTFKSVDKLGKTFIKLSIAIGLLCGVIYLIGNAPLEVLGKGTGVVTILMGMFALIVHSSKDVKKSTGVIATMALALGILTSAIVVIGLMDWKDCLQGVLGVSAMMGALSLMFRSIPKDIEKGTTTKTIAVLASSVLAVAYLVHVMKSIDNPDNAIKSAASMGILMISLAGSMRLIKMFNARTWKGVEQNITMMISIAALATGMIVILDKLNNPQSAIANATSLGIVFMSLAASTRVLDMFNARTWKSIAQNITMMASMAALATGMLVILSKVNASKSIGNAVALGVLINAIAVSTRLLTFNSSGNWQSILQTIVSMTAFAALALGLIIAVDKLTSGDPAGLILKVTALSILIATLSACSNLVGDYEAGSWAGLGQTVVAMAAFVVMAGGLMVAMDKWITDPDSSIQKAVSLSVVLTTLTGCASLLALASPAFAAAGAAAGPILLGALAIDGVIVILGALLVGIGALMTNPDIANFVDNGAAFFGKLGEAIGKFVGLMAENILAGIGNGIQSAIESIVDAIGHFTSLGTAFAESASAFDEDALTGIKNLTEMVVLLTAASLIDGFSKIVNLNIFSKETGIEKMAEGIKSAAGPLGEAIETICSYDYESTKIEAASKAISSISDLVDAIPAEGGLLQLIAGGKDIGAFSESLITMAAGIKDYLAACEGVDEKDVTASDSVKTILLNLISVSHELDNSSGLIQKIIGEKDLAGFGTAMSNFIEPFKSYLENLKDIPDGSMKKNSDVCTMLADAIDSISGLSNTGGTLQDLIGEKDLANFGQSMYDFIVKFKLYLNEITDINDASVDKNKIVCTCVEDLISAFSDLSKSGGDVQSIFGEQDISGFGEAIKTIGTAFKDYSSNISSVSDSIATKTDLVSKCLTSLLAIQSEAYGIDSYAISSALESISSMPTDILNDKSVKDSMFAAGESWIDEISKGIENSKDKLIKKLEEVKKAAKDAFVKSASDDEFYLVGQNLVEGIARGINSKIPFIQGMMGKLGASIVESIKAVLGIHSPSVVMKEEVGVFLIQGIAEGIESDTSAEEAAKRKAQNIVSAFQEVFNTANLRLTTQDLEMQLWEALNPEATDKDKSLQQIRILDRKLEIQADAVKAANAQYKAVLDTMGMGSKEANEAYNTYLQEKVKMAQYASELAKAEQLAYDSDYMNSTSNVIARYFDQAEGDIIKNMGDSKYIISDAAEEASKTISSSVGQATGVNTVTAVSDALGSSSSGIDTSGLAANIATSIGDSLSGGGSDSLGASLRQGIDGLFDSAGSWISGKGNAIAGIFGDASSTGSQYGSDLAGGYASGISDGKSGVVAAVTGLADAAANSGIIPKIQDSHSPSKVTMKFGEDFGNGYIEGIRSKIGARGDKDGTVYGVVYQLGRAAIDALDYSLDGGLDTITDKVIDMIESIGDAIKNSFEDFSSLLVSGITNGFIKAKGIVDNGGFDLNLTGGWSPVNEDPSYSSLNYSLDGTGDLLRKTSKIVEEVMKSTNGKDSMTKTENVTFNQNNYSPDNINAYDTYRLAKGLLGLKYGNTR